ncbi:MAG: TonB-dependent receptor, partial [Flavobacteriaceae bacterium]|nr:TonB-dependent receptor [Flavobacteriaceae bacterium]
GLSYKTERSKYKFNVLHIQNGERRAALFEQDTEISNAVRSKKDNLEYTERSVTNLLFSGKHSSESGKFTTEWKLAPTFTSADDKDVRLTTFIFEDDGTFTINSDAGFPNRIWRDLDETNLIGKVDFSMKEELFGRPALFKAGGLYSYKQRDYIISNFDIGLRAFDSRTLNGDPNAILAPGNIWTPQTNSGFFIRGNFQPANKFDAEQNTAAAYISAEFRPIEKLRAIVGLRAEQFTSRFTGQNNTGTVIFDDEKTIDELDLFPSANFIYELNEKANLRAAYYRTTARPTFKELSVVQINDLLTGLVFLGNIDLQPSYTNNFDLRYEYYGKGSDMFAISGFYKNFDDPIELVAFDIVAPNQFTPRNAPSAEVFGIEFEVRKHFGFISQGLEKLSINTNVSFIESQISMNKGPGQEFESRQIFARDGERISSRRSLQGQSPYLVNTGFVFNDSDKGIEAGLFYNVQGQTLEVVGFGKNPDVFVQPFHSLNATFGYKFGENKNHNLSFKINNLLNDNRDSLYKSFQADPRIFSRRAPRREFSVGYSISL